MRPRPTGISPCPLCAFTCRSSVAPVARFLPHTQVAYRSGREASKPLIRKFVRGREVLPGASPVRPAAFDLRGDRFNDTIPSVLDILYNKLSSPQLLKSLDLTSESFQKQWDTFTDTVQQWIRKRSPEYIELRKAVLDFSLDRQLQHAFYSQLYSRQFSKGEVANQKELANLRYPSEWYPATRSMRRTVHLHVGPTNSGKTYHALKRLEEASSGIYLGPLRLLAHEVYTRLNAKGIGCALVTGEEKRIPEEDYAMHSCTVEMAPLHAKFEVAVIDEIQMINHSERGWAWTQAFLGLMAKEVHVCGEKRAVPIIQELCALNGDKVEIHEYERLSPLQVAKESLNGDLSKLEKGDCVVCFTVLGIHALRREIEKKTGRKVAIVYGSLPPETRAAQAKLFNDPDNDYDFLVASDAIGMGLNLSIKRIIFESTTKTMGGRVYPLEVSEVKQIAGRAGRYRSAHDAVKESSKAPESPATPEISIAETPVDPVAGLDDAPPADVVPPSRPETKTVGFVTTFQRYDFPNLTRNMEREPEPIRTAGLFPPALIIERFASYFPPNTPFSYIMTRLHEISALNSRFFLCGLKEQLMIADCIQPVQSLSIKDRIILCSAPASLRHPLMNRFLLGLAECIGDHKSGALLDLPNLPLEVLDEKPSVARAYLHKLETLHKMIVLYLWLTFRFPNVFVSRKLANHTKELVEEAINSTLAKFSYQEIRKEKTMKKQAREVERMLNERRALEEEARLERERWEREEVVRRLERERREGEDAETGEKSELDGAETESSEEHGEATEIAKDDTPNFLSDDDSAAHQTKRSTSSTHTPTAGANPLGDAQSRDGKSATEAEN